MGITIGNGDNYLKYSTNNIYRKSTPSNLEINNSNKIDDSNTTSFDTLVFDKVSKGIYLNGVKMDGEIVDIIDMQSSKFSYYPIEENINKNYENTAEDILKKIINF